MSAHLELCLRRDHKELKGQNTPEQMLPGAVVGRRHMTPLTEGDCVFGAELNVKCGCRRSKELNYKQPRAGVRFITAGAAPESDVTPAQMVSFSEGSAHTSLFDARVLSGKKLKTITVNYY